MANCHGGFGGCRSDAHLPLAQKVVDFWLEELPPVRRSVDQHLHSSCHPNYNGREQGHAVVRGVWGGHGLSALVAPLGRLVRLVEVGLDSL